VTRAADVERSVTIARTPDEVRAFVLDAERIMEWQRRLREYEQLTPGPPGLGTQARGVAAVRGELWEWTAEIVEWDEAGWRWKSVVSNPRWQMRWDLEPVDDGTRVTVRNWSPALSHIAAIAFRRSAAEQAERELLRLRWLLEAAAPSR